MQQNGFLTDSESRVIIEFQIRNAGLFKGLSIALKHNADAVPQPLSRHVPLKVWTPFYQELQELAAHHPSNDMYRAKQQGCGRLGACACCIGLWTDMFHEPEPIEFVRWKEQVADCARRYAPAFCAHGCRLTQHHGRGIAPLDGGIVWLQVDVTGPPHPPCKGANLAPMPL
ncbi:hypothetical protein DUNSADRAFT_3969 [Dunaliella salina]|uniref:Uncharacterized protein n=1 Tax=Dunaliella salina TaxID=3046 RepID=A0ABQ7GSX9_DUNSA|nr:hypothetical protein DUNSADRAFT_3969 [Dunaliella salina]|eukprot:KAF5837714.1 hypothetical protein DUNSADRAFT_3969 [Dunaliella salina]